MSNDTSTTTVTGSTGKVATLTVTQGSETATLTVPAADMSEPDSPLKYYATTDSSKTDSKNNGFWISETSETNGDYKTINLGQISLSGDSGETYSCTYTITLTKEAGDDMLAALGTKDVVMNLSSDDEVNFTDYVASSDYDLKDLSTSETKTFTATFDLDSENNSKTFDATLYLVNKTETQNNIAGKNLKVKFTSKANCELKKAAGE